MPVKSERIRRQRWNVKDGAGHVLAQIRIEIVPKPGLHKQDPDDDAISLGALDSMIEETMYEVGDPHKGSPVEFWQV